MLHSLMRWVMLIAIAVSLAALAWSLIWGPVPIGYGGNLPPLISPSEFVHRGTCGAWDRWLLSLAKTSEFGMWIFYQIVISFILFWVSPRHLPEFQRWFDILGLLFITCAGTHFFGWLMFYFPAYRFDTYFRAVAVVIGLVGAVTVYPLAKRTRMFPQLSKERITFMELRGEVLRVQREIADLKQSTLADERLLQVAEVVAHLRKL